ncbi:MAG TPA: PAC2 family protein [Gaiellaceae bacterium]|jgi:proteasome assembly chaperone (PAC2) family protein
MEDLRVESRPQLTKPILVASFRGWNDGGQGASMATAFLNRHWHAQQFASIDSESFFDFQSTRPHVSLVDGTVRKIDWPENVFCHARPERSDRDAVVLLGTEPSLRWRTFAGLVTGLAKDLGVELVVTLGALLADVPHTRPAPVTVSANDASVIDKLNVQPSRYEGPTGIVGVLHDSCGAAGIPSVSLWAAVPHYVSLTPSPRAAKALCERLGTLLEVPLDTSELDDASEAYMQQVSEAVAADEETAAYVEELEGRVDEFAAETELPSGDALAAELTRFLREREQDGGDDVARGD